MIGVVCKPNLNTSEDVRRDEKWCGVTKCAGVAGSGTHRGIGDAPPRVRAAVRGTVPAREAAGRRHQPPARLHLVRGVHGT